MSGKDRSSKTAEMLRKKAVLMRLQKQTLEQIHTETGLSHPTIISAYKKFLEGGWKAVLSKDSGRPIGIKGLKNHTLDEAFHHLLSQSFFEADLDGRKEYWNTEKVKQWFDKSLKEPLSLKSVRRYLSEFGLVEEVKIEVSRELVSTRSSFSKRVPVFVAGLRDIVVENKRYYQLYLTDLRNSSQWVHFSYKPTAKEVIEFLDRLLGLVKQAVIVSRFLFIEKHGEFRDWLDSRNKQIEFFSYLDVVTPNNLNQIGCETLNVQKSDSFRKKELSGENMPLTHLQRLEAESIQIMREVVAETENPVMLYSIGKDSAVMLHIAMKAFYPSLPPFPLLHVDTTWKFQDMYAFRDKMVKDLGLELLTYTNPEGLEKGINPFTHGSAIHTDIMKTEALKQALDKHGFDAAFGGARRDEEKSRAKERIFSFRTGDHRWDPKSQRPEIWKQYNAKKHKGESIRVFPISNWTELDIWQYIHLEGIPIVPLYYSAERPVVERDGSLIMVDDERMPLNEGEVPMMKHVRFRTLGCYPLTGAVESRATTLPEIIQEMLLTKTSERQGRVIDHDSAASMEKKKQEGYF